MIRIRRIAAHNFKQLQEVDLYLPERGRFLIQGKNEAGKSTFFEAVFFGIFGKALVTETGAQRFDDLIRYGAEKARVEVWLEAADRLFKIYRTIVRGKPNVWELDIEGPSGVEEVRGNAAVNRRIVQELGFDGEALLNTCFVEQKKLEKLEGMSRAKREESLMRLLNLDTMIKMESEFKVRGEDRLELKRLEQRYELAQIQAELPERERQLAQVEGKLLFIDLQNTVEATVQERRAIERLEEEIATLAAERDSLATKVQRVDHLKEGMRALQDIRGYLERVEEQEREIERLRMELEERRRLQEELPALERRLRSLRMLRSRLNRLAWIEDFKEEKEARAESLRNTLAELQIKQEQLEAEGRRLKEATTTVEAAEARLKVFAEEIREIQRQQALLEWLEAQSETLIPTQLEAALHERQQERAHLSQRFKIGVFGFMAAFLLSMAGALGLVMASPALGIAPQSLLAFLVTFLLLTVGLLVALAWRLWALWHALAQASEVAGQLEGERRTLEAAAQRDRERLAASEEQLKRLEMVPPATVEEGRRLVEELRKRIGGRALDQARDEHAEAMESLAQARALQSEIERGIARLQNEIAAYDREALRKEEEASLRAIEKAGRILAEWGTRARELAQSLGVEADLSAVQSLIGGLGAELQGMRRSIEGMAEVKAEIADRKKGVGALWREIERLYQGISGLGIGTVPPSAYSLTRHDYQAIEERLSKDYEALGGESIREELERVQAKISNKEGERKAREQGAQQLLEQIREKLTTLELEAALGEEPSLQELEGLLTKLQKLDLGDEVALQKERDGLRERVGYLRNQQSSLEEQLGLRGEALDADECRQALEDKRRELAMREWAVLIVETARRRLVERILPSTMEYMRQLLPPLTMHRYYDAELTEEYRIRVWDERAGDRGDWKEKNIFSGGTKDQFSLALRLAFALATLPAERGAAPSFIFLDEPLGSFDDERAKALLYLLTEGAIAESFDQIFLISHVQVSPHLFNYHIVLDGGRVVESDLPSLWAHN